MKIVLLGPPGAGKGTFANLIKKKLKIPHISTGDMLREEIAKESDLGRIAKIYMDKGELAPDDLVIKLIERRLSDPETHVSGYMLDGFPRNKVQAEALEKILDRIEQSLDFALNMTASLPMILRRLTARRVCQKCAVPYHLKNRPPKQEGICDLCGGTLYQRVDDNEGTIRNRLDVYARTTEPMVEFYRAKGKLKTLNGDLEPEDLFQLLLKILNEDKKINHH